MLVQRIDLDDPILAFTHRWIEELAKRVERLYCIGLEVRRNSLEGRGVKVISLGKEQGYKFASDARYFVNLYRAFKDVERRGGVDVIFTHMAPIFAITAAPYAFWERVPLVHWYAHREVSWRVKAAHHISTRVVTSLPTAYRYRKDKVSVVGQGIDTELFSPGEAVVGNGGAEPLILCVGRLSPVKDLTTLLRAAARLRKESLEPFHVSLVGDTATADGERYLEHLRELKKKLGLEGVVSFDGPVPYGEELVRRYKSCSVHVNLTPSGSGDKVALEAMSCGKLSLVANEGYQETLGDAANELLFASGDPEDLARRLKWALSLSPEKRDEVGLYLRERVVRMHGLERLAERLVEIFSELVADSGNMVVRRPC